MSIKSGIFNVMIGYVALLVASKIIEWFTSESVVQLLTAIAIFGFALYAMNAIGLAIRNILSQVNIFHSITLPNFSSLKNWKKTPMSED